MFAYWMFGVRGRRALDGDSAVARSDAPGGCGEGEARVRSRSRERVAEPPAHDASAAPAEQ